MRLMRLYEWRVRLLPRSAVLLRLEAVVWQQPFWLYGGMRLARLNIERLWFGFELPNKIVGGVNQTV